MLGQHPELYAFPELRLFRTDLVAGLLVEPRRGRGIPVQQRTAGLVRALSQLHEGEQSEGAATRAVAWLRTHNRLSVSEVMRHLLNLVAPRIGVEKSPESTRTDQALRRMATSFPRARYIHLVRHPWSSVASMVDAWQGLPYWDVPADRAVRYCLAVWHEQHTRIEQFGASLPGDRFLRVRAEDVVNLTPGSLFAVCRWLEVDAGASSLGRMEHPERSPYATPGPPSAQGGFDATFLHGPVLRPLRLEKESPPVLVASPALRDAAIALAGRFGYEPISPLASR